MNTINYMKWRKLFAVLSVVLVLASLVSLATRGLSLGLDFTGGTQIEVGYARDAELAEVRRQLDAAGFENPVVVHFGSPRDVLIKFQGEAREGMESEVLSALSAGGREVTVRRVEFVGPQVGEELRDDGGLAILAALAVVMLYVSIRFQYKFAIGAVTALLHDVIITVGLFSFFHWDFDLTVLAAVLAVIGYSLNDTIIVYDRIRENFRLTRIEDPVEIINESLTQVLVRTLYTSGTTLLVLLALFFLGGELIHNFATALIIGVLVGTFSSIYVAANLILALRIDRDDLVPAQVVEKPEDVDGMP
jgi:preprotein translocase subunit SecF